MGQMTKRDRDTKFSLEDTEMSKQADRWARAIARGELSAEEAREFNQWISANPAHERRFQAAKQFQRELQNVARTSEYASWIAPAQQTDQQRSRFSIWPKLNWMYRPTGLAALAASFTIAIASFVVFSTPATNTHIELAPPIQTQTAELRELQLPDGSVVTIGAASSVTVAFTESERRVALTEGEAFFDVKKDPTRPFIVEADKTLVRVLGTKFDVSLGTGAIDVAVSEGRVEVIQPEAVDSEIQVEDIKHVLVAGQRVSAPKQGAVRPVRPIDVEDVASWRRGELKWVDTPMRDIISDLNRYSDYQVRLDADELADLEYTLAVQADQIDEAVRLIAVSLELEVNERANGDLVLR